MSAICGEGKGLKELDISITVPGLMRYALMRSRQEFFAILHRVGNFLLLFLRTSFLLSFQPQTLFFLIFRQTRYAKRTQAKTYRTRMPFNRTSMPFDRTRMPFNRNSMPFDRTRMSFDRTFMPFDRTPPWIVNTVDSR